MDKKLYLVDASGYIFRAYYAVRPLSTSKGLPTNALFGFTSMLLKLLREEKPDRIAIVFDVARKTFRNEKYPAYKANRTEPPADLVPQFPYFRKIAQAFNLPVLELPNYEADDVIGTLAVQLSRKKLETVIVTGDKDLMQLVTDRVTLYDSMRDRRIGIPEVREKLGVDPAQVPDLLGLAGDSSDNIPGVPGIGEKTAVKLIGEYGPLENILKQAAKIKGKMGENLRRYADEARLFKELATVVTNAPLQYDFDDFRLREPNPSALRELFLELEFRNFLKEFGGEETLPPRPPEPHQKEIEIGNYLLDPDKRSLPVDDFDELKKRLEQERLMPLFREVEMPLVSVLDTMERNGVKIDTARLQKTSREYEKKLTEIEKEVHKMAGVEFNLNSTKQLQAVLFEKMGLPVIRRTKTGFSTDGEVLTELAKNYEVPRLLIDYRSLSKLKSTYLDALPRLVNPESGRIHTSFHQTVAATGRLSSSDPNLQNIPIRTEEGRKIREAFVAEEGCELLSADYSQIELRILAHLSQDPALVGAFEKDLDIHRATAARIFATSEEKVSERMRAVGKTVNFAVLYGQSPYGLSQQLQIPLEEAENYIRNYYSRYATVAAYKEKILAGVKKEKIVRTLFGRLRRFPEINSPNGNIRAMTERTAFNTVFQGTAADIIKKAMIEIQTALTASFPQVKMILQVHDELVFEIPHSSAEEIPHSSAKETQHSGAEAVAALVREKMEAAASLLVPLKVDIGFGPNWAEAH